MDVPVPPPVPVPAAPEAIVAPLPALLAGRLEELPASEDPWVHAAAVVAWSKTVTGEG
ncbi:hypothetical protein BX265_8242 [Streptomyces sp. TLI_235]|nr:hypothetical protein [Streptomyces sp. TLI_235]PBC67623.1 hypothetical protein BX265_8242 [Streptomyces sp. TLI_235]